MSGGRFEIEYEILELARMRLYQHRHGLAVVLGAVGIRIEDRGGLFETDGRALYLDAGRVRETFAAGSDRLCLEILHMMSHCLLGHVSQSRSSERAGLKAEAEEQVELDREAWKLTRRLWAEEITWLREAEAEEDPERLAELLYVDCHEGWTRSAGRERFNRIFGENGSEDAGDGRLTGKSDKELLKWWNEQGEALKRECVERKPGGGTAKRRQVTRQLIPDSGHRGDYRAALRRFSAFQEESRVNPEEFSYAWYHYGIENYGNMPFLEPLEYREARKIRDLVIVIDTSGSCERDLVRVFLEETKGILEQEEFFFRQFCLHLIQCDNQIQRDDRIENREQFEEYLENLEIQGGGGTDFGPAFAYVEELRSGGELRDLKGMLYFTDGSGLYPGTRPDYEVYFVMLEGRYDAIDMPEWIHRLILKMV